MIKHTSGTKEWADYNVNCVKGCYNNCRYCYAKFMAKRFNRTTEKTWKNMKIRKDIITKRFSKFDGRVMFPSSHDIIDKPKIKEACFTVLGNLLASGNDVLITTKPKFSTVKEIIDRFEISRQQIQFRFTITSKEDKLLSFWEPNAPEFKERLKSLIYAYKRGFKTSVSSEPFLDYNPKELVEIVRPFITESLWIGRMNYIPCNGISRKDRPYYEEIRKNYETEHLWDIYNELKEDPKIRFKDSIKNQLMIPLQNTTS